MMTPADVPRVQELARAQNERDGTSYPVPEIFVRNAHGRWVLAANVPLALVTERNGIVEQGHTFLRTLEVMSFGTCRRATAASLREIPAVYYLLQNQGYEDLHMLVPKERVGAMEHRLAHAMGLDRDDDRLAHFYTRLKKEA